MKIHNVAQGSDEWKALRAGIPTASEFDSLVTPKKMEPTKGETREAYLNVLLAEHVLGVPLDSGYQSERMAEGNLYEQEAADDYKFKHAVPNGDGPVTVVGFVTRDDGLVGCSPDRFVGEKGLLELKVTSPGIHMGYVRNPESLRMKHRCQTQGQLYVCDDREWVDTASYCKILNSLVVVRSKRERDFQEALDKALWSFVADLMEQRTYLKMNHAHLFVKPAAETEEHAFGIGAEEADAMVEAIWAASQSGEAV